jgi:hypothetical protein
MTTELTELIVSGICERSGPKFWCAYRHRPRAARPNAPWAGRRSSLTWVPLSDDATSGAGKRHRGHSIRSPTNSSQRGTHPRPEQDGWCNPPARARPPQLPHRRGAACYRASMLFLYEFVAADIGAPAGLVHAGRYSRDVGTPYGQSRHSFLSGQSDGRIDRGDALCSDNSRHTRQRRSARYGLSDGRWSSCTSATRRLTVWPSLTLVSTFTVTSNSLPHRWETCHSLRPR